VHPRTHTHLPGRSRPNLWLLFLALNLTRESFSPKGCELQAATEHTHAFARTHAQALASRGHPSRAAGLHCLCRRVTLLHAAIRPSARSCNRALAPETARTCASRTPAMASLSCSRIFLCPRSFLCPCSTLGPPELRCAACWPPCAYLVADEPLADRRPFGTNRRTPASSAQNLVGFFLST
jgi:hypothetical protein